MGSKKQEGGGRWESGMQDAADVDMIPFHSPPERSAKCDFQLPTALRSDIRHPVHYRPSYGSLDRIIINDHLHPVNETFVKSTIP